MWNVCVQPSPGHFICDTEQSLTEQHLNLEKREKATFTHVETVNATVVLLVTTRQKWSQTPQDLLVLLMFTHVQDDRSPRVECTSYSENVECNEEREMHKGRKGKEWCSLFSFLAVK